MAVMALSGQLLTLAGAPVCRAQTAGGPPASIFQQLFPVPTGENGYEELVQAGELAHDSARLEAALQSGASLKTMRAALADPPVVLALRLLRIGIAKPVRAMRPQMDADTVFPELRLFRNLGRLLQIEAYVLLADGRNAAAIDCLRDGLILARAVQSNFALSGLVGVALDALAVEGIARHLDVFSLPDCDRLLRLLDTWLAQPSPLARVLQGERDFDIALLRNRRTDSGALTKLLGNLLGSAQSPPSSSPQEIERLTRLEQWVAANPQTITPVVDQAAEMVDSTYQQVFRTLAEPTWTWRDPWLPDEAVTAGQLATSVIMPVGRVMERYVIDRAKIQLLAVHAAIRRFRWENNRLPGSLQELNLGDRARDPFTGAPLIYTRTADTYELSSAGGRDRGTPETPPTGARIPLSLTPQAKP
jgi:hypothetical protein